MYANKWMTNLSAKIHLSYYSLVSHINMEPIPYNIIVERPNFNGASDQCKVYTLALSFFHQL